MSWTNVAQVLSQEQQERVIQQVAQQLDALPLPVKRDRKKLEIETRNTVSLTLNRLGLVADALLQAALTQRVVALVGGLGFINDLLPGKDRDTGLSEIALNPDGSLWVLRKGAEFFKPLDRRPPVDEVWRAVESLIAPLGRSISESIPSVDAKLPRLEGMGGARIKVIHPLLAPGNGYPSINIRLFEPTPVKPEKLLEWQVAPLAVIEALLEHVRRGLRLLVIGGTASGKTTLLSALCHAIPTQARVVKIEDPEEIWLDHPNVVTLEARPAPPGSSVPPYTVKNGVDDAMRMAPKWLIVGEVRHGDAALALFRAQMSDHPGLSTFHAEGPEEAIFRMAVVMWADAQVAMEAAKAIFAQAVDLIVQVGWSQGVRKITGAWEVAGLQAGEVQFKRLYSLGDERMQDCTKHRW
jgi:pilus assembly protein CpaF